MIGYCMKQDWLEDLIALLDTGSLINAALARNISQSAFSRRIQSIETEIGAELIDRSSKPIAPSRILLSNEQKIRQLSFQQKHLLKQMKIESQTGSKQIVVAAQHAISTSLGEYIINAISIKESKAHVRLRSANYAECSILLLTEQADLGLIYKTQHEVSKNHEFLDETIISQDQFIPVFSKHLTQDLIEGSQKKDLHVISYPTDTFFGAQFNRYILPNLEAKYNIITIVETALSPAALEFASASVGVAWVPKALAQKGLDDGNIIDLSADLGKLGLNIVAQRHFNKRKVIDNEIWSKLSFETK